MNYNINLETGRLELIGMTKEMYQGLAQDVKNKVKAYFTFSRYSGCWVSKSTKNHFNAKCIAEKIGLTEGKITGSMLTDEEMIQIKIKKAENRIAKYERYYQSAINKANNLQSEFKSHSGDIAYVTQPNINSSKGRAFTNQRNRVIKRYEKGFEEFGKASYFLERLEAARKTLENLKNK
jgi:hypothetical protein